MNLERGQTGGQNNADGQMPRRRSRLAMSGCVPDTFSSDPQQEGLQRMMGEALCHFVLVLNLQPLAHRKEEMPRQLHAAGHT